MSDQTAPSGQTNSVAIVTNITQYAGPAAARGLVEAGFTVVCHDRTFIDAEARAAFAAAHPTLTVNPEQDPRALIETTIAQHGQIDALVSNDLATLAATHIEDAAVEDYRATIEALMVRPFLLAQAVVPHMKTRGCGRIIMITSASALQPLPEYAMYVSARGGASTLAVTLAKELGPYNIQVNAIARIFFRMRPISQPDVGKMIPLSANLSKARSPSNV
jgi:NAD(P)-dependent dehydrogenase (short-subunit alcohol dehydrogenase family)